eukprot:3113705-Alexandrium_andersonii.AAC.1
MSLRTSSPSYRAWWPGLHGYCMRAAGSSLRASPLSMRPPSPWMSSRRRRAWTASPWCAPSSNPRSTTWEGCALAWCLAPT